MDGFIEFLKMFETPTIMALMVVIVLLFIVIRDLTKHLIEMTASVARLTALVETLCRQRKE